MVDRRFALLLGTALLLGWPNAGCTHTLEHEITIGIDFEDECAFLLPDCGTSGYRCVDSDGVEDSTCMVSCVYARSLTCEPDGPACTQTAGEDVLVPVVCRPVTP